MRTVWISGRGKSRSTAARNVAGDVTRGLKVYDNVCAACHRYSGRGVEIGPNLETVRGWDREKLVLNILDPNREVAGNYIAYVYFNNILSEPVEFVIIQDYHPFVRLSFNPDID